MWNKIRKNVKDLLSPLCENNEIRHGTLLQACLLYLDDPLITIFFIVLLTVFAITFPLSIFLRFLFILYWIYRFSRYYFLSEKALYPLSEPELVYGSFLRFLFGNFYKNKRFLDLFKKTIVTGVLLLTCGVTKRTKISIRNVLGTLILIKGV